MTRKVQSASPRSVRRALRNCTTFAGVPASMRRGRAQMWCSCARSGSTIPAFAAMSKSDAEGDGPRRSGVTQKRTVPLPQGGPSTRTSGAVRRVLTEPPARGRVAVDWESLHRPEEGSMLRFGIVGSNFISEWFAAACLQTGGRAAPSPSARATLDRPGRSPTRSEPTRRSTTCPRWPRWWTRSTSPARSPPIIPGAAGDRGRAARAGREDHGRVASEQAEDILRAATAAGVIAMEAVRNVHTPRTA